MARDSLPRFAPAANPLVATWNEMLSTRDAYIDTPEPGDEPLWQRLRELETEIENARPDNLVGLAVQCRYLEHSLSIGSSETQIVLIGWIAAALARLAGVELQRAGELASPPPPHNEAPRGAMPTGRSPEPDNKYAKRTATKQRLTKKDDR